MIKLKSLLREEKKHVDYIDGKEQNFITIPISPTSNEKSSGQKSWDVVYTGDDSTKNKKIMFHKTYQVLKRLALTFEEVSNLPTYSKDGEMHTFARTLKTLEQKFKEYIIKKGKTPPSINA